MSGLNFKDRIRLRFFVVSHHGDSAGAELVYSWLGLIEHFMPRLKDGCPPIDFGPTEDRILAATWSYSASGEPYFATGEFEGERFFITVLPPNCLPFDAGDWFWENNDAEIAEETANGILHAIGPLELAHVVGAVQTRPRWGFVAPAKGTDGGLIARWFDSEREGMEALERVHAEQKTDEAEAADERARADQEYAEGAPVAEPPPMTPRQIELARNALGLPTTTRRSYRNRFVAAIDSDDAKDWSDMVEAGYAIERQSLNAGKAAFALTRAGAERALKPGEALNSADFPSIGAHL